MSTRALCKHNGIQTGAAPRGLLLAVAGALGAASVAILASGCSAPDSSARVDPIGPDRAQFDAVAPMLVRRCGTMDCHGSKYRNMRLYGYGGTRVRDAGTPASLRWPADYPAYLTYDEIEASYQAVIGLEPEIMRDVVKAGGAGADRLTLVRKGRGGEQHKGHQRIKLGDDADKCLLTWLASAVDVDACNAAGCVTSSGDGGVSTIDGANCAE